MSEDINDLAQRFRRRMQNGDVLVGGWLTVRSPEIAEALATTDVSWIAADLEHGSLDIGSAATSFIAMERHGVVPFARMTAADPAQAHRLLDMGAQGLLVPVVESADEFADFAKTCFYPPAGTRGSALGRFNKWGDLFKPYREVFTPILVPMIETRTGIENAIEIASLDCVDALFFGPYDLSADLGTPGDFTTDAFLEARDRIKQAADQAGKPVGGHQVEPSGQDLGQMIDDGFRLIAYGTDVVALRTAMSSFTAGLPRP